MAPPPQRLTPARLSRLLAGRLACRLARLLACLCLAHALHAQDALLTDAAHGAAQDTSPSLRTRWAADVTPERVLPEYPRPQMTRPAWQNLNGPWDYAIREADAPRPEAFDGRILVPFAVESQLGGVRRAVSETQRLWYRRTFVAPALPEGGRLLLHFGAVDWEATVTVNGREVGTHRGGYDPFTFDITDALKSGDGAARTASDTATGGAGGTGPQDAAGVELELVVSVRDPTDHGSQPRGKQVSRPESIWYTAVTGIWQTVWLEPVPRVHIAALAIVPDLDASTVSVRVAVEGAGPASDADRDGTRYVAGRLVARGPRVIVTALDGTQTVATNEGVAGRPIVLHIQDAHPWSPDDPFLYSLHVRLEAGDEVESYFGLRKIALGPDEHGVLRLCLNNAPLFQLGLLDQGWWPDGLYTAPTDEALRFDIETTRRLGFNLARKHVKVEPERWYFWCDKLGLLVWQDMPSGGNDTPAAQAEFADELDRVVDALANHPSIVMWVPFNEGWGQHDTADTVAWLKERDPTRLVDNASGWTDEHVGDVADVHDYPGPKLPPPEEHRARVLGEFGGLGLPLAGHTWLAQNNWGYRNFETTDALGVAYRELIGKLVPLVEQGLSAAVYTQTTDVEIEVNGAMTYDRAVVKLPADAATLNASVRAAMPKGAR